MQIQTPQVRPWNRPVGPGAMVTGNNPRFNGLGDKLAKIFQPITEQFVWGFTAQDVVALWVPRDATALTRSRDAYDVSKDPAMQGVHPFKQWMYSIYRNIKGLNYSNAWEETLREVETGPGLLIAQSILMGLGATALIGKMSLMMGYEDLKNYSQSFGRMLNASGMAQTIKTYQHKPELLDKLLQQNFITRILHNGHFKSGLSSAIPVEAILKEIDPTDVHDANQMLINLLKAARKDKPLKGITFQEALNTWTGKWTAINPNGPKAARLNQIDSLEGALKRLTYWFNDSVRHITDPHLVNKLVIPELSHDAKHAEHAVEHVVENLRKFRPFITDAQALAAKEATGVAQGAWTRTFVNSLSKATTKLLKAVTLRKAGLSIAATALAGWVVVTVSAIAQRGKSYPANSKFMLTGTNPNPNSGHGAPHFQGAPVRHAQQQQHQVQFSRQSSQPAQFVEPAAVSFAQSSKGGAQ